MLVLNKYDERRESEDSPLEKIIKELENGFGLGDKNIYRISGQQALNYIIMNYGNEKAREEFVNKFFIDNGYKINLKD